MNNAKIHNMINIPNDINIPGINSNGKNTHHQLIAGYKSNLISNNIKNTVNKLILNIVFPLVSFIIILYYLIYYIYKKVFLFGILIIYL